MTKPPFPLDLDELLATLVHLLQGRGETKALAVLAAAEPSVVGSGYESYDEYLWDLVLLLDPKFYVHINEDDREEVQKTIAATAGEVMKSCPGHGIGCVTISPQRVHSHDWRADAKAFLRGEGVTNQGRVRTDNIASQQCDGLLFRSQAEIRLYKALKGRGVSFAPLPVFVRGGDGYRRIEPDFIIIKDGTTMAVEVDGDTVHHETPVEAHNRTKMLADEGVYVERVSAGDCATDETAAACANRLLAILAKHSGRR